MMSKSSLNLSLEDTSSKANGGNEPDEDNDSPHEVDESSVEDILSDLSSKKERTIHHNSSVSMTLSK